VVLDSALGRGNFGYEVARRQAEIGLHPDTISSDLTAGGRNFGVGLLDSMSKFLALGYSLPDVVRMTTANAARAMVPDPCVELLWGNPMRLLVEYLRDPGAEWWGDGAVATCVALMRSPAHLVGEPMSLAAAELVAALRGWAQQAPPLTTGGNLVLAPCAGRSGLPLAVLGRASGDWLASVGVLAVLDDRPSQVGGADHERRWRDWLRWSNVLQFLPAPRNGHLMPLRMAELWTRRSLDLLWSRPIPLALSATPTPRVDVVSPQWEVTISYSDPSLAGVARALAAHGVPVPEAGGEVGDDEVWQVEYSWPQRRIAVVVDHDPDRDAWLSRHGWQVHTYRDEGQEAELVSSIRASLEAGER